MQLHDGIVVSFLTCCSYTAVMTGAETDVWCTVKSVLGTLLRGMLYSVSHALITRDATLKPGHMHEP